MTRGFNHHPGKAPNPTRSLRIRLGAILTVLATICLVVTPAFSADKVATPFRIGFSTRMFTDVDENDAKTSPK